MEDNSLSLRDYVAMWNVSKYGTCRSRMAMKEAKWGNVVDIYETVLVVLPEVIYTLD